MRLFSRENNKVQPLSYWTSQAHNYKKLIVFYGQDVLDLTKFAPLHPAGQKALTSYLLQDIKNILFRVYPHPSDAVETLLKYKCGKLKNHKQNTNQQNYSKGICKDKSSLSSKKQQNIKKVSFETNQTKEQLQKNLEKLKIQQSPKKKNQKQLNIKIEENSLNFEQNKPALMVPFFNVKLDWLSKQNKMQKQVLTDSIINTL